MFLSVLTSLLSLSTCRVIDRIAKYSYNVNVTIESSNPSLNDKGFTPVEFQDGIYCLIISDNYPKFKYNTQKIAANIYIRDEDTSGGFYNYYMSGEDFNTYLLIEDSIPHSATLNNGYAAINNDTSVFYACNSSKWDPHHLISSTNQRVGIYNHSEIVPSDCEPIKIKVTNVTTKA